MEATKKVNPQQKDSALDRPLGSLITLNWASVLFIGILLVTVVSRYAMLGERTMSHDETSHVYFSWLLEQGCQHAERLVPQPQGSSALRDLACAEIDLVAVEAHDSSHDLPPEWLVRSLPP